MIYNLTSKGLKLWPEASYLETSGYVGGLGFFNLYVSGYKNGEPWKICIAEGPLEIEALIRLGLISDATEVRPFIPPVPKYAPIKPIL